MGAVVGSMRTLYRKAMQLEVRFFSAVPGVPARLAVGILVVDFDETLTEVDTTPSVIATAIDAAEGSASGVTRTHAAGPAVESHVRAPGTRSLAPVQVS